MLPLTSDTLQVSIVSGLLVVARVPKQRITLTREDTRDPGVLVRDTPDSHTNALLDGKARRSHAGEGGVLESTARFSGGGVQADIDLSVGDIDAEVGGGAESSLKNGLLGGGAGSGGSVLGRHVALVTDAVDLDAVGLDELHNTGGALGLLLVELKVVVVVWEFD